jgi:hypothetical protein
MRESGFPESGFWLTGFARVELIPEAQAASLARLTNLSYQYHCYQILSLTLHALHMYT